MTQEEKNQICFNSGKIFYTTEEAEEYINDVELYRTEMMLMGIPF